LEEYLIANQPQRMQQVISAATQLGLDNVDPVILSDGGNFIVHLAPYQLVARMASLSEADRLTGAATWLPESFGSHATCTITAYLSCGRLLA